MPPKLNPDPTQTSLKSFYRQQKKLDDDDDDDSFISPDLHDGPRDGLPVIQEPLQISESIESIVPRILGSISPDAQSQSQSEIAAAADQAAAAAAAAAAAQDARAVARGEGEQGRYPSVLTQFGHIPSPSHSISPQPPLSRRPRGGSVRMNKMNFLTFRGRHKSTKSKMKKRAKVTRKSYKRRSQRKRTGKK